MRNFLLIALLLLGCGRQDAEIKFDPDHQQFQAVVQRVIDGDTFVLDDGTKIRIKKIDAPEDGQRWSSESTAWLKEKILNKTVTIDHDLKTDRERLLAGVYLGDEYINRSIVEAGLAWNAPMYNRDDVTLYDAQNRARAQRRGIWQDSKYVAPWEYRRNRNAIPQPLPPAIQRTDEVVYVTDGGSKFHHEGCRFIKDHFTAIQMDKAFAYEPCSVCGD